VKLFTLANLSLTSLTHSYCELLFKKAMCCHRTSYGTPFILQGMEEECVVGFHLEIFFFLFTNMKMIFSIFSFFNSFSDTDLE